jgi:hypothetical protein
VAEGLKSVADPLEGLQRFSRIEFDIDAFNDWPPAGGLWQCACGWTGTWATARKWELAGKTRIGCAACSRNDLIQYVQASVAAPIAWVRQEFDRRATDAEAALARAEDREEAAMKQRDGWVERASEYREALERAEALRHRAGSRSTFIEHGLGRYIEIIETALASTPASPRCDGSGKRMVPAGRMEVACPGCPACAASRQQFIVTTTANVKAKNVEEALLDLFAGDEYEVRAASPPPPQGRCGAQHPTMSAKCFEPKGHAGDHCGTAGMYPARWEQAPEPQGTDEERSE